MSVETFYMVYMMSFIAGAVAALGLIADMVQRIDKILKDTEADRGQ